MDYKTKLTELWARTNKAALAAFFVGLIFGLLV